jgi:hypothetical protein
MDAGRPGVFTWFINEPGSPEPAGHGSVHRS